MTAPVTYLSHTANFWVLAEYESSSSPGKVYQVRTSKNDEKTYCTCRGWVNKLNQAKRTGCEAVCTHISQFRKAQPAVSITIATELSSVVVVKRAGFMADEPATLNKNVKVRRS